MRLAGEGRTSIVHRTGGYPPGCHSAVADCPLDNLSPPLSPSRDIKPDYTQRDLGNARAVCHDSQSRTE